MEVQAYSLSHFNTSFRLVDTPGFDNEDMSDPDILMKIAQHLSQPQRVDRGITGIIFIHPAEDTLQSMRLQRNLNALLMVFLGEREAHRLTIVVAPSGTPGVDPAVTASEFRQHDSTIFRKLRQGAAIKLATGLPNQIDSILYPYSMMHPTTLPLHQIDPSQWMATIEAELNYGAELTRDSSPHAAHLQKEYDRVQELYINLQNSSMALQQQLQQLQKEYASLQSQAQTQCAYSWKEISEDLEGINAMLKQVGRSISDHLSDCYVKEETFGKKPGDVTTLDARAMPQLISWLKYDENVAMKPSLLSSSDGVGLDAEAFFDFSIRSKLCYYLLRYIFVPFHPLLEPDENDWLMGVYNGIKQQESQYMAGRWRSTTFNHFSKSKSSTSATEHTTAMARHFFLKCLNPLIIHFFGCVPDNATWDEHHRDQLYQLFEKAYKWNARLKGEVIMLGDFEQTAPSSCSVFDPSRMKDFDTKLLACDPPAQTVLATLGLGVTVHEAVGGGNTPRSAIIHKAVVATDRYYIL
ncbi:unnamed protein product [Rhizoctonia solani]|uniref:Uncharacterized protein n=1 Tax=Rhizoctonia solani TaxID=456999 RepID=A0A8H3BFE5_9AGAM|nr:unnamed protein product [Rhizoctonia solani]